MHLTVLLSYHRSRENSIKKGRRMMAKAFCDSLLRQPFAEAIIQLQ